MALLAAETPAHRLLDLIGSSWRTQAVHAMVRLRLADLLARQPLDAGTLAREAGADPSALARLLRALVLLDLLRREDDDRYATTPMGALLRSDVVGQGLSRWAAWWSEHLWPSWALLHEAVRTGRPVREQAQGQPGYAYQASSPATAAVFHGAMAELTALVAPAVADLLASRPYRLVVDVGGGHGELLAHLLKARPAARGILFDQAHALGGAPAHLARHGVLERCTLHEGDFLDEVPPGADVYLVKSVLHNLDDASALRLLRRVGQAMPAEARLVLIERWLGPEASESGLRDDLNMLVGLGGRGRDREELARLLAAASLACTAPPMACGPFLVIQAAVAHRLAEPPAVG